ncbi:MAG: signal peptidase I [Chloroflexota bacterium]
MAMADETRYEQTPWRGPGSWAPDTDDARQRVYVRVRKHRNRSRGSRRSRQGARIGGRLIQGLLAGAVTSALLVMTAIVVPSFFGYQPMVVMSGSMAPTLKAGDIAVMRPVDPMTLELGDVITYQSRGRTITHRIIRADVNSDAVAYVLRGDANESADPVRVTPEKIQGEVVYRFPKLGLLVTAANSPTGRVLMVGLPGLTLASMALRSRFSGRAGSAETHRRQTARRETAWRGKGGTPEEATAASTVATRQRTIQVYEMRSGHPEASTGRPDGAGAGKAKGEGTAIAGQ